MITIDWVNRIISIPQSYLTSLGGSLYEMDINQFRKDLKDLEDDASGMPYVRTHNHNSEVTLGGVTLARVVEIINGYTITFEDLQYAVNLVGANSNISEVANINQVSIRSFNSAGLIVVSTGTVSPADVWDYELEGTYSAKEIMRLMSAVLAGKISGGATTTNTIRDINDTKDRVEATVDTDGNRTAITLDVS